MAMSTNDLFEHVANIVMSTNLKYPLNGRLIWHEWLGQVSLQRLTKKEDCANRIVVLTVASCMMSLSDLPTYEECNDKCMHKNA